MNQVVSGDMAVDIEPFHTNGMEQNRVDDNVQLEPPIEELEQELPVVHDGQIPLGDLLSRVVQTIYAELTELAETMPNMSDSARKRTLADWVVKTKKQVVKLYAVAKWSRDADTIQKSMNITAFLLTQNQQFDDTIQALARGKDSLDPARLRNHDLLTSLDVLTTGSYLRLPTCIKKLAIPQPPLTDAEVRKTLTDMEDTIRYRLRTSEIVPVEMNQYRIADGRVHFTVPKLFKTSLCLRGKHKHSGWFFVYTEFLINVGGDLTGLQEFPRVPTGIIKRHITDEADARLAFYLPPAEDEPPPPPDAPPRPELPDNVIDAPLVRVYNFLQMMSLSYQLEILWYQAIKLRSLGWGDFLTVQMSPDRKTLKASYWIRPALPPSAPRPRNKISPNGGTLTISIIEAKAPPQAEVGPARTPKRRVLARLQRKAKLGEARPSDEVEGLRFSVTWEPAKHALGVVIAQEDAILPLNALEVDADNLDFEAILRKAIRHHSKAVLATFHRQLTHGPSKVFAAPSATTLTLNDDIQELRVRLCGEETVIIAIDARTGRLDLRNVGDLAAAGRGPRMITFAAKLNQNPAFLLDALFTLRITTIVDLAEQKARYLGLQSYRRRNIKPEELPKLGPDMRAGLYIQLEHHTNQYLVLIVTDERFRYCLISVEVVPNSMFADMIITEVADLDFNRLQKETAFTLDSPKSSTSHTLDPADEALAGFSLDTQTLRELYSYCCARVAFFTVERQFKTRRIPFTHVAASSTNPDFAPIQSSLARVIPALCVQSKDILSNAPAAEAAMPNIRVIPLNWWSSGKVKVVTCVKLKYVQQPMGKTEHKGTIIRPSKSIIYDAKEAIVSFLSDDLNNCVEEFLHEWSTVSRMVVIAREVAQLSKQKKWPDVRLLSFDLQTVEFAYARDYTVSISCEDQLSPTGGNFELDFSRAHSDSDMQTDDPFDTFNPHVRATSFLTGILTQGQGKLAPSLYMLVSILRDTLPIVIELETIRREAKREGRRVETIAKAAGWYRLLYGDLRYGLDFRLMKGGRVAILDASRALFDPTVPAPGSNNTSATSSLVNQFLLKPIPNFSEITARAVKSEMVARTLEPGKVASIDLGVVCNSAGVGPLTRAIHPRVLERLKQLPAS